LIKHYCFFLIINLPELSVSRNRATETKELIKWSIRQMPIICKSIEGIELRSPIIELNAARTATNIPT